MTPEQITSGARTVAHLAGYFEELKAAAGRLIESASAVERGYFSPSEEETVRRLQVSYWKSRAALFDVIDSVREDADRSDDLCDDAFLVAYGAAVLLVDAARFLRESFEPLPLVREKLNEPEPAFEIPSGTYATVQKSLTSPRHAWHLYHAMHYFEDHAAELRARSSDGVLAPVLAVIERLQSRLDVPVASFAKARAKVRSRRIVGRLRDGLAGRALYGIQKLAASLTADLYVRPGHHPELPEAVSRQLCDRLRPGDVIVCRKAHAVTNYFLPGYWKHVALYLGTAAELAELGLDRHENVRPRWSQLHSPGDAAPRRVLESMKDGVRIRGVDSPLRSDSVAALRPRLTSERIAAALARGLLHEGKPYDFDFDFTRADRMVCTEVVYRSYDGMGAMSFELTRRAGRLTLSAEDLIGMSLAGRHFEPVAVFAPEHSPQLAADHEATTLLRRTQVS